MSDDESDCGRDIEEGVAHGTPLMDHRHDRTLGHSRDRRSRDRQERRTVQWMLDKVAIEMFDEPTHSFASADNARAYEKEVLLVDRRDVTSAHGLVSMIEQSPVRSTIIGAGGGRTGVHRHSCLLTPDVCFVAVGSRCVCLSVPDLEPLWQREVDTATCFGLHLSASDSAVFVHGELEISKWGYDGRLLWTFGGADIFTGSFHIAEDTIVIEDFKDRSYRIDARSGRERSRPDQG